ncbi:MAG TPA: zinc ribbon domain-containing protein [Chloroflexia bacterium]|nr:zinc ribbon domain-containing protein [Chloroflexia bacterium]
MPIYEYRCAGCKRRVNVFFPSFSVAERRTEAGEVECPNCGSKYLSRLMSKAYMVRGGGGGEGGGEFDDGGDMGDMEGMNGMFEGLDDADPRSVARWARRMQDNLGGEMNLGPEFDQALSRIESGEDPDKVMEDMDPAAFGGMGGEDDGGGLDDFDADGDL